MKSQPPAIPQDREALERLPKAVLVEQVWQQQQAIANLVQEVERLKGLLHKDSQTSSKPPSTDLIKRSEKVKPPKESNSTGRKPGGQPGHIGKTRKGFGRIDRYELCEPLFCPVCGGNHFHSSQLSTRNYVVAQLVERPVEIVEYQQVQRICYQCGERVGGELPENIIPGQDLSTHLQGMLAWLGHYGHLSYAKQQEWLREWGKIEVGVGTLEAISTRVASAVSAPVKELQHWIPHQSHVHADESPWLVNGVKEWLWVISGQGYSFFHAGDTRSRAELEQILGQSFAGVLSSDDFSVYNGYQVHAQQKCLAHLRRHFKQVSCLKMPHQKELGSAFIALIDEAFARHRQWRETREASAYASWAESFRVRVHRAIETWRPLSGHAAGLLLKSLTHKAHQWWYFLDHPQVPPDNNRAERALRLAVTKRKVAGGSRSWQGFRRSATLLTVIESCRAQGRSVVEFFERALSLATRGLSHQLSLIPISE
ncbi:IS66 family transposase [Limnospira fusiformis]|uniref:IS66 family transposase n=1 Tax=Limnospira fusiformis TaxID=54297 RepID=UPI0034E07A5E